MRCDTDGRDFDTDWYRWTIGRLQQVFLMVRSASPIVHVAIRRPFFIIFYLFVASRTGAEIQQYVGDVAVHIRFGFAHFGCFPTVCCLESINSNPRNVY